MRTTAGARTAAQQPTFTEEELRALVETAHSSGRPVAVHATTAEGMRRAVLAGVDTIEHGFNGTPEVFRLMAARGVAYLPTLTAEEAYAEYFEHYVAGKTRADRRHGAGEARLQPGDAGRASPSAAAAMWACSRTAPTIASSNGWCAMA